MIKIYVAHASGYEKELYTELRKLKDFDFILPHENNVKNSKKIISECDVLLADVSVPSHGVGIEIGWAESYGVPILLISKKGAKTSSSLKIISENIIEYNKVEDILPKVKKAIMGFVK